MRVQRLTKVLFAAALLSGGALGCDGDGNAGGGGSGGNGGDTNTNTTTTSATSSTTTSSTTTTSTTLSPGNFLGLTCSGDSQCGPNGKCIGPNSNDPVFGGGAAGGYCTKDCTLDADCGIGNVCDSNECLLGCIWGDPPLMFLNDELDGSKCNGREDVRCDRREDGNEVCIPTCGNDSQCGGRKCDPLFSVCVDNPNTGKALGAECDPMAADPGCAGTCLPIGTSDPNVVKPMCTSQCVMAGVIDGSDDCGGIEKGICLFSFTGTGPGDEAFCAQSCTAQEDCQYPNYFCFNINVPSNGVCLPGDPCTSDAQCDFTDAECTETTLGKFCMSPTYPLGGLTPTGMGGSGGTGGAGGAGGGMGGAGGGMGGAGGAMGGAGGAAAGAGGM